MDDHTIHFLLAAVCFIGGMIIGTPLNLWQNYVWCVGFVLLARLLPDFHVALLLLGAYFFGAFITG